MISRGILAGQAVALATRMLRSRGGAQVSSGSSSPTRSLLHNPRAVMLLPFWVDAWVTQNMRVIDQAHTVFFMVIKGRASLRITREDFERFLQLIEVYRAGIGSLALTLRAQDVITERDRIEWIQNAIRIVYQIEV